MVTDGLLGLKVDVDTRRGMEQGVPVLLDILSRAGVRATFFLSFGPDNSGRAVFQALRHPRFLFKMVRTNAPALYGFRTALYGTLLKAPLIAAALPEICRRIEAEGHEVEFHAWDHRGWQDTLPRKSAAWIRDWFDKGLSAYATILGHRPRAFGAPGWMLTGEAVEVVASYPWEYLSCTRATAPFIHAGTGLLELPSDLPCLEEVGGRDGAPAISAAARAGGVHVLPVHAEVEGTVFADTFAGMLRDAAEAGVRVVPLSAIAAEARRGELAERPFRLALLRGRAFRCAV